MNIHTKKPLRVAFARGFLICTLCVFIKPLFIWSTTCGSNYCPQIILRVRTLTHGGLPSGAVELPYKSFDLCKGNCVISKGKFSMNHFYEPSHGQTDEATSMPNDSRGLNPGQNKITMAAFETVSKYMLLQAMRSWCPVRSRVGSVCIGYGSRKVVPRAEAGGGVQLSSIC